MPKMILDYAETELDLWFSMSHSNAVGCNVLQCVAACCSALQRARDNTALCPHITCCRQLTRGMLQRVAVCCEVLQCVAVCCIESQ